MNCDEFERGLEVRGALGELIDTIENLPDAEKKDAIENAIERLKELLAD